MMYKCAKSREHLDIHDFMLYANRSTVLSHAISYKCMTIKMEIKV